MKASEIGRQNEVDGDAAALGKAFDEPFGGGAEAGFIKQRWVQEMRNGSGFGEAAIDNFCSLFDQGGWIFF